MAWCLGLVWSVCTYQVLCLPTLVQFFSKCVWLRGICSRDLLYGCSTLVLLYVSTRKKPTSDPHIHFIPTHPYVEGRGWEGGVYCEPVKRRKRCPGHSRRASDDTDGGTMPVTTLPCLSRRYHACHDDTMLVTTVYAVHSTYAEGHHRRLFMPRHSARFALYSESKSCLLLATLSL